MPIFSLDLVPIRLGGFDPNCLFKVKGETSLEYFSWTTICDPESTDTCIALVVI